MGVMATPTLPWPDYEYRGGYYRETIRPVRTIDAEFETVGETTPNDIKPASREAPEA